MHVVNAPEQVYLRLLSSSSERDTASTELEPHPEAAALGVDAFSASADPFLFFRKMVVLSLL